MVIKWGQIIYVQSQSTLHTEHLFFASWVLAVSYRYGERQPWLGCFYSAAPWLEQMMVAHSVTSKSQVIV
jgi:hypothetical protein